MDLAGAGALTGQRIVLPRPLPAEGLGRVCAAKRESLPWRSDPTTSSLVLVS